MQQKNKKRKALNRTRLSLGIQLAVFALCANAADISPTRDTSAQSAPHAQTRGGYHDFDVPALSLDAGLVLLARQAGVELYLGSNDLTGRSSNPVKGRLSLDAALQQLLANQAVAYSLVGAPEHPVIQVRPVQGTSGIQQGDLAPIYVHGMDGKESRDEKGYNDIYDQDTSSVYSGKEQIERMNQLK